MFGKLGDFLWEMSALGPLGISKMVTQKAIGFDSLTVAGAGSKHFDENPLRWLRWLPMPKTCWCCQCRAQCTFRTFPRAVTVAPRFSSARHVQVTTPAAFKTKVTR